MRHRKHRMGSEEINLTPLLDVLFAILFIVMLAGTKQLEEAEAAADARVSQVQSAADHAMALELEKEKELTQRLNDYEEAAEAISLITLVNTMENGKGYLYVYEGASMRERQRIALMTDENVLGVIEQNLDSLLSQITSANSGKMVYAIFRCDEKSIHTKEYDVIEKALSKWENDYEGFFYKIADISKEV